MKIISYNINGLRAILRKNVLQQLIQEQDPDILCLQETKCPASFKDTFLENHFTFHKIIESTTRKGYSGVAIFSKLTPLKIITDFPHNSEGRLIILEFDKFFIINTYTPNSKADLSRLDYRINTWEPSIRKQINDLQQTKPIIFVSDFNVAPTHLDIWTTKGHEKSHGFTIEERTAFTQLIQECKLTDTFRHLNPITQKYTWFSNFGKARENNKGWRIDHILVSNKLKKLITQADILNQYDGSDHKPIYIVMT